jgi:hypothetical protein
MNIVNAASHRLNMSLTSRQPMEAALFVFMPLYLNSQNIAASYGGATILQKVFRIVSVLIIVLFAKVLLANEMSYRAARLNNFNRMLVPVGVVVAGGFFLVMFIAQVVAVLNLMVDIRQLALHFVNVAACVLLPLFLVRYRSISDEGGREFLRLFQVGLLLFFIVNFSLAALGVRSISFEMLEDNSAVNKTLAIFGVHAGRTYFPWSSGLNGFATMAAVGAASGLTSVMFARRTIDLFLGVAVFLSGLVGVVLTDSRGSLMALFVAGMLLLAVKLNLKRLLGVVPLLSVAVYFSPLLIYAVAPFVYETSFYQNFDRGQFSDPVAALTTGRSYIWSAVIYDLRENPIHYFLGNGFYGHVSAGISKEYAFLWGGSAGITKSTHSAILQTFVDMGWLGVMVFLSFTYVTSRLLVSKVMSVADSGEFCSALAMLAAFVVVLLSAQSEVAFTAYSPDTLFVVFSCVMFAAVRDAR